MSEDSSLLDRPARLITIVILVIIAIAGAKVLWSLYSDLTPWQGGADTSPLSPAELTNLGIASIRYMTTLATGAFAAIAFLLKQGFLSTPSAADSSARHLAAVAATALLAMSVVTGFVALEAMTQAAHHALIIEKFSDLRNIRLFQSALLAGGVIVLGVAVIIELLDQES